MDERFVESMIEQGLTKDDALLYVNITMDDSLTQQEKSDKIKPIINRWLLQHTFKNKG